MVKPCISLTAVSEIIDCLSILQKKKEIGAFLRDLLTEQELLEISRRWEAAKLLSEKVSYVQIGKQTGLSSTTIARVSRWLKDGKGGYRRAIQLATKLKAKRAPA